MSKQFMTSTSLLKFLSCIVCLLSVVSVSATIKPKYTQLVDRIFQMPLDTSGVSVSQNSKFLMPGQEIEITVQVCRNKDRIKISTRGLDIPLDENGTAVMQMQGGSVGKHKIDVDIRFFDLNGKSHVKTYTIEYEVGYAYTIIDESNLNILYIGVDNPIDIVATGGNYDNTTATIKDGGSTITKSGSGRYIAKVSTVSDECIVSVFVDNRITGAKKFRAVNLPIPQATIGDYISGNRILANDFWNQAGVRIAIADFPFKVNYKVLGYTIKVFADPAASKSFKSSSSQFPPDLKKYINRGSLIIIDDITVEEPEGRKIKLAALVYFID